MNRYKIVYIATIALLLMNVVNVSAAPASNVTFLTENGAKTGTVVNGAWYPDRTKFYVQGNDTELAASRVKWEYVPNDEVDDMREARFAHPELYRTVFEQGTNTPAPGSWRLVVIDANGHELYELAHFGRAAETDCGPGWRYNPGWGGCEPIRYP